MRASGCDILSYPAADDTCLCTPHRLSFTLTHMNLEGRIIPCIFSCDMVWDVILTERRYDKYWLTGVVPQSSVHPTFISDLTLVSEYKNQLSQHQYGSC